MDETPKPLQCEMSIDCGQRVTHIGSKGYVYCTEHAIGRRVGGWERTRKMTASELRVVQSGRPLTAY